MWTTQYAADTDTSPEAVWRAIQDLHCGQANSTASDTFEIHGPFAVGTELSVTPQGQDTFLSKIIELDAPVVYADKTIFGDVTLVFRHSLEPLAAGGTRVTHQLEITGPASDEIGPELGAQISADFPEGMQALFELAQRAELEPR